MSEVPKELLARIEAVTNRRARFVLDSIVKNGIVTTEEINSAGYEHPPRAARDVRELGFSLKTIKVKHSNGRAIGAYVFDEGAFQTGKAGRRAMPKKTRDAIVRAAGGKCQFRGAEHNLQVDHRIPYEVGGEPERGADRAYQVLCGSCNRKKSWECESCRNWLSQKTPRVCGTCYWADPASHTHVAMREQPRADVIWIGDEVEDFDRLRWHAKLHHVSVADEIKSIVRTR
jgi:hypothetical protein